MDNLRYFREVQDASVEGLVTHLRQHALRTDGPFTLRSGTIAAWYLDGRQTTLDGPGAVYVGRSVLGVLDERAVAVGGMTMGADPIAVAAAVTAAGQDIPLRAFSVRKEAKAHGLGGRLVGPVVPGDVVSILEDTTSTGGALLEAVEVARQFGLEVVQAISLVDRSDGKVAHLMEQADVAYTAIVLPEDLGVAD
jgi:orotate phosphoribosyltransferase